MVYLLLVGGGGGAAWLSKQAVLHASVLASKKAHKAEAGRDREARRRRRRSRQIVEVEDRVCDVSVVEFLWIAMGSLGQIQMGRYDGGKKI
jgi:hypothetical protein